MHQKKNLLLLLCCTYLIFPSCKKDSSPVVGCVSKSGAILNFESTGYWNLGVATRLNRENNRATDTTYYIYIQIDRKVAKLDKVCNKFDLSEKNEGVSVTLLARAPGTMWSASPHSYQDTTNFVHPRRVYPLEGKLWVWVSKKHMHETMAEDPKPYYNGHFQLGHLKFPENAIAKPEILKSSYVIRMAAFGREGLYE